MTSRSGQEREPPRFVDLDLLHVDSAFRRKNQFDDFRTAIGGMPTRLQSLLRVKEPRLCLQVYMKELLLLRYANAMPTVWFHCTVS